MQGPITRLVIVAGLAAGVSAADAQEIAWRNADLLGQGVAVAGDDLNPAAQQPLRLDDVAAATPGARVIVTLPQTPSARDRADLAARGVTLLAPLGPASYFARVDANAQEAAIAPALRPAAVARPQMAHKLHERLLAGEPPAWSVVEPAGQPGPIARGEPIVAAYVALHADETAADGAWDQLLAARGVEVRDKVLSVNTLVVEGPLSEIRELSLEDGVQWVEPPLPRLSTLNASNRIVTQADQVQAAPYGLDGSGVTVFVYDGGRVSIGHNDFSGRATLLPSDFSGTSNHATHVAGTIGGDGSANPEHRGMAPGVSIVSSGFEWDGSGIFLYNNPGDLEQDYSAALAAGAVISNNSIGSNTAPNGFPCSIEGDYGLTAATIDAVVRGSLGEPITIFWAAGNERGSGACGSQYFTSAPPANNKNAITVGALNSNNDSVTGFTSWGPSDDGRIRPVISAPGCQSNGDGGVTSTSSFGNASYDTLCGTSMASPTAAGLGALLLQDFRANFPSWGDPSNALIKTLLIQTAADVQNTGPDYQTGYGSLRVRDAIDFTRLGNFDEVTVDQGAVQAFEIAVAAGEPLKITIAWDDVPGTPNVNPNLVNDLDLVVIDPDGVRHFPWTLNPGSPASPAVRTQEDHLNNIEQVVVDQPVAGNWSVQIVGTAVAQGPQAVAIASSASLTGAARMGLLTQAPTLVPAGTVLDVEVSLAEGLDTITQTPILHYTLDGASFTQVPMSDGGDGQFAASLPRVDCGDTPGFFVTASASIAGDLRIPFAAGETLGFEVGEIVEAANDSFELASGWSVSGSVITGAWERGTPQGTAAQPNGAFDGTFAFVTGAAAGSGLGTFDVDGGITILTSPAYDITGMEQPVIEYTRWFSNDSSGGPNNDPFTVEISDDNGATWSTLEFLQPDGPGTSGGWITARFDAADFVDFTPGVRVRFIAQDTDTPSLVEAAVDLFRIEDQVCVAVGGCNAADIDADGQLTFADVTAFIEAFNTARDSADTNGDGELSFADATAFIAAFNAGCP